MTTAILDQLATDEPELGRINAILKPIFIIFFPHYCLGQGFIQMSLLYNTAQAKRQFGIEATFNPFKFDEAGKNLVALSVQGCLYYTVNMLIQYNFFVRFKPTKDLSKLRLPEVIEKEDDDVMNERERILSNEVSLKMNKKFDKQRKKISNKRKFSVNLFSDMLSTSSPNIINKMSDEFKETTTSSNKDYVKLINLTKVYKKFDKFRIKKHLAVNSLSLGINKGECFGLIG
jgi:hypothetical protein